MQFSGVPDAGATTIDEQIKLAAVHAITALIQAGQSEDWQTNDQIMKRRSITKGPAQQTVSKNTRVTGTAMVHCGEADALFWD